MESQKTKTALIYDERFLLHSPPFHHPENPERLRSIIAKFLNEPELKNRAAIFTPAAAAREEILLAHTSDHYEFVRESIAKGITILDGGDTYACKESLTAALLAAGSVVTAVNLVQKENFNSVFCAVRPPGHHAESNRVMGFCLFNNIAVGVQYYLENCSGKRAAIVDWDVHHGNGTQEIFYNSSQVLFISLHQHPLYPGTGMKAEKGFGKGENFTMNFPLPAKSGGSAYLKIFREEIIPELNSYQPEIIFISAGFDAHKDDPLADMLLTENDYAEMTRLLKEFSLPREIPIISILEGGYNLNALSNSVAYHLKELSAI